MILGIDVGGSATKLAALDETGIKFNCYIPCADESAVDEVNKVLREANLKPDAIAATGVGCAIFDFSKLECSCPVTNMLEINSLSAGAEYLTGIKDKLTVSIGTGTAFVLSRNGEVQHIGGSAFGGGALHGLSRKILGRDIDARMDELYAEGDLKRVDLLMCEMPSCPPTLDPNLTAANLVKTSSDTSDADWAIGLLNLVLQTIGSMAYLAASAHGVKSIIFIGGPAQTPYAKNIIAPFGPFYGMDFIIPEHPECATAIGAAYLLASDIK